MSESTPAEKEAPGAGKTRPALEFASELLSRGDLRRVVVLCPTTPLTRQWAAAAAILGTTRLSMWAVASSGALSDLDALLAEQVAYYRARAQEYSETAIPELPTGELMRARDDLIAALDEFRPSGHVLELACGPGARRGA